MTPRDESRIREWNDRLPGEVTLRLVLSRSDEARNHELTGFCDALSRITPAVQLKKDKAEADDPAPALEIAPTLRYQAAPLGLELPPFLDALAGTSMTTSHSMQAELEKIPAPVYFKLYVAQTCPHCPLVVRQLAPLALAGDTLHLTVIDGGLFTEAAEADGIQVVPTLILDDDRRWTGSLKPEEILDVVVNRDPAEMSRATMERIIKEGKADRLARLMLEKGEIFPPLFDILTHEKWHVRLGAMVVVEALADEDPKLADRLIPPLWDRYKTADTSIKGDILYVLGTAGSADTIPLLQEAMDRADAEEVEEAASEALEAISDRI
jgi:hypothetical protein